LVCGFIGMTIASCQYSTQRSTTSYDSSGSNSFLTARAANGARCSNTTFNYRGTLFNGLCVSDPIDITTGEVEDYATILKGIQHYRDGDLIKARNEFIKLTRKYPGNPDYNRIVRAINVSLAVDKSPGYLGYNTPDEAFSSITGISTRPGGA